jgi:hypothetical protein
MALLQMREALRRAMVEEMRRDDAVFLAAVGASGRADLVPSLTVGATRLEDEMAGPYAFVAALLGDGAGLRAWTAAAKDGDGLAQQDAVELLLGLSGEERAAWAAKLSAGKAAAGGLKLIRAPSVSVTTMRNSVLPGVAWPREHSNPAK